MTVEPETNKPNDAGFGGDPTTPEPDRGEHDRAGEDIAVPAGDLTGPITDALEPDSTPDR